MSPTHVVPLTNRSHLSTSQSTINSEVGTSLTEQRQLPVISVRETIELVKFSTAIGDSTVKLPHFEYTIPFLDKVSLIPKSLLTPILISQYIR